MAGVYVVLGVGLVVSYLVLIAEIIWKRKQEMKVEGQLGNDRNSNFPLFTGVIPVVSNLIRNSPSVYSYSAAAHPRPRLFTFALGVDITLLCLQASIPPAKETE